MRTLKYLLIVLILIIISLPLAIKYGAIYAIKEQGAKNVSIESVFLNLFTGKLEISGLHIYGENNQGLHSDKLLVDISLQRLLDKQAFIEEVLIQNFALDVEQQTDKIIIAGLTLPASEENKTTEQQSTPESKESTPWGFGIDKLNLQNVTFNVKSPVVDSKFAINNLTVKSIYSWLPANSSEISLDLAINDNPIHLETSAKLFQETLPANASLKITELQLEPFIRKQQDLPFDKLAVKLNTDLRTTFEKHGDNIKVKSSGFVSLNNVDYISTDHEIRSGKLQWKGDVVLNSLLPLDLAIDGTLSLDEFSLLDKASGIKALNNSTIIETGYLITVKDQNPDIRSSKPTQITIAGTKAFSDAQKLNLFSVENISIKNLALESLEKIELENFQVQEVRLLENTATEKPIPILTLDKLEVASVTYTPAMVTIDKINVDSLNGKVVLNEKAELVAQNQLEKIFPADNSEKVETPEEALTQESSTETKKPVTKTQIVIKQFDLNGKSKFNFTDNSVTPIFNTELHEINVSAKNIDSSDPGQSLEFTIATNIDEYGQFNFAGIAKPFAEKLDANIKGDIKSVELIPFSAYSGKAAGIHIKRGILHADIQGDIKQDIMQIENTFILDQLNVESDDSEASKDFLSSLPMPLDLLLDVLRDKQNKIELKIPVDGNVQDPQFSLQDVYNTAMKKALKFAATRYLTQMVQPLGLIMTASDLAQKAMAPKFESLLYAPGISDLSEENIKHLDNISKLLSEREMLRLTLCGTATQDDWPELQKTLKEIPAEDKDFKTKTLLKLADERTKKAKRYLVENKSIDAKRLLSCNPKILKDTEKEKTKPQLEISL